VARLFAIWIRHQPQRNATLSGCSLLNYYYWAYLAQPAGDRKLYRLLRQHPSRSIVELGVGRGERTRRMLEVARRFTPSETLRYTGIDLFEARVEPATGLKLKEAHQRLHLPGVKVQLVPGDPFSALSRTANNLRDTDLVIIRADQDSESVSRAWYYVPRMLHAQSLVLWEQAAADSPATTYQTLSRVDVDRLA
jgi:predicted O-methyltransferase YrrM